MKKQYLLLGLIIIFGIASLFIINRREKPILYQAVRTQVKEYGESKISLEELLDFNFDYALFFQKTNPKEIYEVIGIQFINTDLTMGLIFVKDEEIIYYELFPQRWQGISPRPSRFTMQDAISLTIFEPEALFIVGETMADHLGGHRYWMRPYLN